MSCITDHTDFSLEAWFYAVIQLFKSIMDLYLIVEKTPYSGDKIFISKVWLFQYFNEKQVFIKPLYFLGFELQLISLEVGSH